MSEKDPGALIGKMQPKSDKKQYRPNQSQYAKHEKEVNHSLKKMRIHALIIMYQYEVVSNILKKTILR